jgi:hypothetical protein
MLSAEYMQPSASEKRSTPKESVEVQVLKLTVVSVEEKSSFPASRDEGLGDILTKTHKFSDFSHS